MVGEHLVVEPVPADVVARPGAEEDAHDADDDPPVAGDQLGHHEAADGGHDHADPLVKPHRVGLGQQASLPYEVRGEAEDLGVGKGRQTGQGIEKPILKELLQLSFTKNIKLQ